MDAEELGTRADADAAHRETTQDASRSGVRLDGFCPDAFKSELGETELQRAACSCRTEALAPPSRWTDEVPELTPPFIVAIEVEVPDRVVLTEHEEPDELRIRPSDRIPPPLERVNRRLLQSPPGVRAEHWIGCPGRQRARVGRDQKVEASNPHRKSTTSRGGPRNAGRR